MIIDQEFKGLIPRLTAEEYEQLEKNIIAEGCRDALVTWRGILIDGHNRYEVCSKHGIEYKTVAMEFADKEQVIDWIINNQLGRRNLTPTNQSYLRGLQYQREKKKIGAPENNRNAEKQLPQNEEVVSTAQKLATQHNVSKATIERDAEYTKAVDVIVANTVPEVKQQILNREIPITKKDTLEIAKAEPEEQKEIIRQVVSGESKTVKEAIEKKAPHVSYNSGNNEWYTPEQYILAAKEVMGEIDLDPASSEFANQVVGAKQIYTVDDDGLAKEWAGKVWLNPPYAGELVSLFCNKIAEHYNNGDVTEAIILVNNATETGWFGTLIEPASSVVFLKGRVRYYTVDGTKNTPLQGQAVVYMGKSPDKFLQCFSRLGWGAML